MWEYLECIANIFSILNAIMWCSLWWWLFKLYRNLDDEVRDLRKKTWDLYSELEDRVTEVEQQKGPRS